MKFTFRYITTEVIDVTIEADNLEDGQEIMQEAMEEGIIRDWEITQSESGVIDHEKGKIIDQTMKINACNEEYEQIGGDT
jgi:hypothetical protein